MALLRDFHSQPIHGHAVFTLWVYQPTVPCPTLSAAVMQNQFPKDIAML